MITAVRRYHMFYYHHHHHHDRKIYTETDRYFSRRLLDWDRQTKYIVRTRTRIVDSQSVRQFKFKTYTERHTDRRLYQNKRSEERHIPWSTRVPGRFGGFVSSSVPSIARRSRTTYYSALLLRTDYERNYFEVVAQRQNWRRNRPTDRQTDSHRWESKKKSSRQKFSLHSHSCHKSKVTNQPNNQPTREEKRN